MEWALAMEHAGFAVMAIGTRLRRPPLFAVGVRLADTALRTRGAGFARACGCRERHLTDGSLQSSRCSAHASTTSSSSGAEPPRQPDLAQREGQAPRVGAGG